MFIFATSEQRNRIWSMINYIHDRVLYPQRTKNKSWKTYEGRNKGDNYHHLVYGINPSLCEALLKQRKQKVLQNICRKLENKNFKYQDIFQSMFTYGQFSIIQQIISTQKINNQDHKNIHEKMNKSDIQDLLKAVCDLSLTRTPREFTSQLMFIFSAFVYNKDVFQELRRVCIDVLKEHYDDFQKRNR